MKALLLPEKGKSLGVLGKASLESSLLIITEGAAAEIKASRAAVLVRHFGEFVPSELFKSLLVCGVT